MKYRDVYILKDKVLVDSGTETIELAVVDPISEIWIRVNATNGATSNKNNPLARNITKIEVIDGADVLFSMDGRTAQALAYYWAGKYPAFAWQEYGGAGQEDSFPIFFGRWLWDPAYALIPQRFRNLQLKISWNLATVNAVGATGFVTGTGRLNVIARLMEEVEAAPGGFMMHKNHMSFTSASSGEERVPLPTDYPYAIMMIRAWESGVGINDTVSNVKFSIDHDKDIPFDINLYRQSQMMLEQYGLISHGIRMFGDPADVKQVWLGLFERANLTRDGAAATIGFQDLVNGQMIVNPAAVSTIMQCQVQGFAPFNCVAFPFGLISDPATYLNAPAHGDIKAIITQANAGGEIDIILSQLRMYGAGA